MIGENREFLLLKDTLKKRSVFLAIKEPKQKIRWHHGETRPLKGAFCFL